MCESRLQKDYLSKQAKAEVDADKKANNKRKEKWMKEQRKIKSKKEK